MNERDSESVAHDLVTRGYELVTHEDHADIILLNTCSVREKAEQKFHRVSEYLDQIISKKSSNNLTPVVSIDEEVGSQNTINQHLSFIEPKVTSFVSIMQGCNMNCSFCIVPKTRGRERYREIEEICEEVTRLSEEGVREVTLLGQIVNAYGRGKFKSVNGKTPFVQLLEKIHDIRGIERIRFIPHPSELI